MGIRLGISLGPNSLGWCLLRLDAGRAPTAILAAGVYDFSASREAGRDPQTGASLAIVRRVARSARRRRDRRLRRKHDLMEALMRHGLMPTAATERKELETLDPYEIRARALDERIPLAAFARALFHLHQRRGFQPNRQRKASDEETGPSKEAIARVESAMAMGGARTYGEFLWFSHRDRKPVRARNIGKSRRAAYLFYPAREVVEQEFERLWSAQAPHHSELTDSAKTEIASIMFRQRPLKKANRGRCMFMPSEERAPWALPILQRLRIHQDATQLKIEKLGQSARELDWSQRRVVVSELLRRASDIPLDSLAKKLGLGPDEFLSIRRTGRKTLKVDQTAKVLAHKERFGTTWRNLSLDRQQEVVERLLDERLSDEGLIAWLAREFGLPPARAEAVASANLPPGDSNLGRTAAERIVAAFEAAMVESTKLATGEACDPLMSFRQACDAAGLSSPSDKQDGSAHKLPYYGDVLRHEVVEQLDAPPGSQERRGRIPNPTLHIGLNQIRKVTNAIIQRYGKPDQVVVELSRDLKLNGDRKEHLRRDQIRESQARARHVCQLKELGISLPNRLDLLKLSLWEELDPTDATNRHCVFTGEPISLQRILSTDVAITHILPLSETLDGSPANQTVCVGFAKRAKANKTPYEAFGASSIIDGHAYDWNAILERVARLPPNKRWRFQLDAMDRFERRGGLIEWQLTDAHRLARLVKRYLGLVCTPDSVCAIPGRLTSQLRSAWGLNTLLADRNYADTSSKRGRKDHRHQAIDAFVVACSDRMLLTHIANAVSDEQELPFDNIPQPFPGYRRELSAIVESIVVAHRPDHASQGKLHDETACGQVKDPDAWGGNNLVYRRPLAKLSVSEVERIRDACLRTQLQSFLGQARAEGISHAEALGRFGERSGVRRVRLLRTEHNTVVVRDRQEIPYKLFGSGTNHRIEIFELSDGAWRGEGVRTFDANQQNYTPVWRTAYPDARLVMRLHKGDMLALGHKSDRRIMLVKSLQISRMKVYLVGHAEAGNFQQRHEDEADPFRWQWPSVEQLQLGGARKVRVDLLGRVWHLVEQC